MPLEEPLAWSAGPPTMTAWEQEPYDGYAPSPAQPTRAVYGPWIVAAAIIAALIIAAAIIFTMRGGESHSTATTDASDVSSPRQQPGIVAKPPPPVTGDHPAVTNQITFESMRDFVSGLYGELPANAREAWSKLDSGYQARTGFTDYLDFWSTIDSVTVVSVMPRDATSVVARLAFVPRSGEPNTEDRWLSVVLKNGVMLVYDSQRIGTVS